MGLRCDCRATCFIPIIIGIIAGIIATIFHILNLPFLIIALVLSIIFLVLLIGITLFATVARDGKSCCCVCRHGKCLLAGIFGTLITSTVILVIGYICGLLKVILTFLVVGFFFWMVVAFFLLIKCLIKELCD